MDDKTLEMLVQVLDKIQAKTNELARLTDEAEQVINNSNHTQS